MRSLLVLAAVAALFAACGDDDDASTEGGGNNGTGTVAIAIEPVDGVLIEGFELAFRLETAGGELVDRVVWNDFVAAEGDGTIEAFYETVYEAEVPAGTITVLAQVNVGIGPPPEPVDPAGELACRLEVEVGAGERAEVEVALNPEGDCLRLR
jgi:hypothetical protein